MPGSDSRGAGGILTYLVFRAPEIPGSGLEFLYYRRGKKPGFGG